MAFSMKGVSRIISGRRREVKAAPEAHTGKDRARGPHHRNATARFPKMVSSNTVAAGPPAIPWHT